MRDSGLLFVASWVVHRCFEVGERPRDEVRGGWSRAEKRERHWQRDLWWKRRGSGAGGPGGEANATFGVIEKVSRGRLFPTQESGS